jgi:hypothetical protein
MCVGGARGLLVFMRYIHVCGGCTGVACVREICACVCGLYKTQQQIIQNNFMEWYQYSGC